MVRAARRKPTTVSGSRRPRSSPPKFEPHNSAQSRLTYAKFSFFISELVKQSVNIITIAAFALVGWTVYDSVNKDQIVIEPISLTKAITESGYTEQIAAMELHDVLRSMSENSSEDNRGPQVLPSTREAEITAPGTGVTLTSVTALVRKILRRPQTRISGEFICGTQSCSLSDSYFKYRIFGHQTETGIIDKVGPRRDLRDFFNEAGEQIIRKTSPYTLAAYLATRKPDEAIKLARELANSTDEDAEQAYRLVGVLEFNGKNFDKAVEIFATIAKKKSLSAKAHLELAQALTEQNKDLSRAEREYKWASVLSPSSKAFVNWGGALTALDNHPAAIRRFQIATWLDDEYVDAHVALGDAYGMIGDRSNAYRTFEEAIKINPAKPDPYVSWADMLASERKFAQAFEKYKYGTETDPNHALAFVHWGDALVSSGDYESAIQKFEIALNIKIEDASPIVAFGTSVRSSPPVAKRNGPKKGTPGIVMERANSYNHHFYAYFGWGDALTWLGNYPDAIKKYREALSVDPKSGEAHLYLADTLSSQQISDYDGAIIEYKKVIEIDPININALLGLGFSQFHLGEHQEAIINYKKVLEISPNDIVALRSWAISLYSLKSYPEAIEKYSEALVIDTKDIESLLGWGDALISLGKYPDAVEKYREALRIDPNNASAHLSLGRALLLGPNPDVPVAIASFEEAARQDPSDPDAFKILGDALSQTEPQKAIVNFEKALKIDGNLVEIRVSIAKILTETGDFAGAKQNCVTAIESRSDLPIAHYCLGVTSNALGQFCEAKSAFRQYLELEPTGDFAGEVRNELRTLELHPMICKTVAPLSSAVR